MVLVLLCGVVDLQSLDISAPMLLDELGSRSSYLVELEWKMALVGGVNRRDSNSGAIKRKHNGSLNGPVQAKIDASQCLLEKFLVELARRLLVYRNTQGIDSV